MHLSLPPFWASWLPLSIRRRPDDGLDRSSSVFSSFSFSRLAAVARLPLTTELRIDVQTGPEAIASELQSLHGRLHTPGDSMHGIAHLPLLQDPRFTVHFREADGERYVYIEDVQEQRLAGYTVFNRLIEINKRADRLLRAPHSKFAPEYQRKGLATAVYRWALDGGQCLMTGARQSDGAHALWDRLAQNYEQGYVHLQNKTVTYLGARVDDQRLLDDLNTRRILLGRDWSMAGLASAARMEAQPTADRIAA